MPQHQSLSAPAGDVWTEGTAASKTAEGLPDGEIAGMWGVGTCSIFVRLRESVLLIHWRRSFLLTK